jgi:NDP-sugar pyrophosphorylase family protein
VDTGVALEGPFYVGPGCHLSAGAGVGPDAVLTDRVTVHSGARVRDSVAWHECVLGPECLVEGALLGPNVRVGRNASVGRGVVLGEGSALSDFSRVRAAKE